MVLFKVQIPTIRSGRQSPLLLGGGGAGGACDAASAPSGMKPNHQLHCPRGRLGQFAQFPQTQAPSAQPTLLRSLSWWTMLLTSLARGEQRKSACCPSSSSCHPPHHRRRRPSSSCPPLPLFPSSYPP